MNKAIDEERAKKTRKFRSRNRLSKTLLVLTLSQRCLLKRLENLTAKQAIKLKELLAGNLFTVRTNPARSSYTSSGSTPRRPGAASSSSSGARQRCPRVSNRSKELAYTLRDHRPFLLN